MNPLTSIRVATSVDEADDLIATAIASGQPVYVGDVDVSAALRALDVLEDLDCRRS